jgi:two-component system OmpR family response regulator
MIKILLLEDDEILSQSIQFLLQSQGYDITIAKNGEDAVDITFDNKFDLYLLDVNVPLINGFDFLKQLRDSGDMTLAFFITALVDIDSISQGFDVGADDYIKKPFEVDELLIRIKALLKKKNSNIKYANLEYDFEKSILKKDNKILPLAFVEKEIFELLLKNIDKTVTKEEFFEVMEKPTDTALRVHINRLKKLLSLNIVNIRGTGYILEAV